jgi:lipoprotein NlpD
VAALRHIRAILLGLVTAFLVVACATPPDGTIHADKYRVHRGDTLYGIAWRFGLDPHDLARWNGIGPPYTIYPGQYLIMQPTRALSTRVATAAPPPAVTPSPPPRSTSIRRPPTRPHAVSKPRRTYQPPAIPNGAIKWTWPAQGKVVQRYVSGSETKKGINIEGKLGEPVRAAAAGQVVYSGSGLIGYGKLVIINHNRHYLSAYAHNKKLLVREGEKVKAGQEIAELGETNAAEPILHFEIRKDGKPVNPLRYLPSKPGSQ